MISVIVPIYNAQNYLAQCLDSLLRQTFTDLEIIAVNDGSSDDSLSILRGYAAGDKRLNVIDLPANQGVANARNVGIAAASGEWLSFVDSDDWVEKDRFEKIYRAAEREASDAVIDGFKLVSRYGKVLEYCEFCPTGSTCVNKSSKEIIEMIFDGSLSPSIGGSGLFASQIAKDNNLTFQHFRREDLAFCLDFYSLSRKVSIIAGCSYNVRDLKSSLSRGITPADSMMGVHSMDRCAEYLRQHPRLPRCIKDYREHIDMSVYWDCLAFARKVLLPLRQNRFREACRFLRELSSSTAFRLAYENASVRKKLGFRKKMFGYILYRRHIGILVVYMKLKQLFSSLQNKNESV